MNEMMVELFKHNTWANLKMIGFCRNLPPEQRDSDKTVDGTYGSVRLTLAHLVSSEEHYLRTYGRLDAEPVNDDTFPGWEELENRARRAGDLYEKWVNEIPAGESLSADFGPRRWTAPTWVIVTQLINHSTEHRGHAGTVLSQIGVQPPALDLWAYGGEMGSVTAKDI